MTTTRILRQGMKLLAIFLVILAVLLLAVIGLAYFQQDRLVTEVIDDLNTEFAGHIGLEDSHISPFKQFPYISIDLENLKIFEGKEDSSAIILHVKDAYMGFDLLSVLKGKYDVNSIALNGGFLKLVQHKDGNFNIMNALATGKARRPEDSVSESLHLDLQSISLKEIDILKLNESNDILLEAYLNEVQSSYKALNDNLEATLKADLLFNLIVAGDTSFVHDKHIEFETGLSFSGHDNLLEIAPTQLLIEQGQFLMEGIIDIDNNMDLRLHFEGNKPNFNLFLAFVPQELTPLLQRYDNGGHFYFEADINGPSINGYNPQVEIDFGASEAFVRNNTANKAVNDLNFRGHFSNGEKRNATTMSLTLEDFSAKPETGEFTGSLTVKNFESPDIEMKLLSRFNLDFLAGFLNLNNLVDVSGDVSMELNFHDIIDLSQPEKSIERLNESYFTRLEVKNLNFRDTSYALPIRDVNILAVMDGHRAVIDQFEFRLGRSNLAFKASVSDLPAILHHTDTPVDVVMDIKSSLVDLQELTTNNNDSLAGINEKLSDLALRLSFKSSAKAFTESPYLPVGEFFIEDLHATFANYPHRLHDFHADVLIDENNFKVVDFSGMIDQSDFHFNGTLENYAIWFVDEPVGATSIDFNLKSSLLELDDLFTYGGENFVPADYRHEEFRNFNLHGLSTLNFEKKLLNTEIAIDHLAATMKVHPLRFENFSGNISIDSTRLTIRDFGGTLGNTSFTSSLSYFFNPDSATTHTFSLQAERLDFDQLFSYNPPPAATEKPVDHDAGFNIFELPFPNMGVDLVIKQLNYHRYQITDFVMQSRMQTNHFVYLDSLRLKAAGGQLAMSGYFNGSDPNNIYFNPRLSLADVNLDQLLFKFENFGQDQLVSDNLHGQLTGTIWGKIHMHTDLVPSIEDSELHIDFSVFNGSINNFPPFMALSDYFADKNLKQVRFDTLSNNLHLNEGTLTIPAMNINSTLGYFELSGKQSVDLNMDYTMRIPLKLVSKVAFQKLFGNKQSDTAQKDDEIQYRDESKRTRFVNINIKGNPDNYNISLGSKGSN